MAKCPDCVDRNGKHIDSGTYMGKTSRDGKMFYKFRCVSCNKIFELEPASKQEAKK